LHAFYLHAATLDRPVGSTMPVSYGLIALLLIIWLMCAKPL